MEETRRNEMVQILENFADEMERNNHLEEESA
jgi:hypothetical protein